MVGVRTYMLQPVQPLQPVACFQKGEQIYRDHFEVYNNAFLTLSAELHTIPGYAHSQSQTVET